ncbi:Fe-S cluster assembly sulfur transfer protein SufU [Inmirania thermothiophila]|uniref:Fe-S cluster assembly protein SufU n=1 Tax=Inmirania thermothiophila TaxID=1750597 RepID=A0A3N1Y5N0_9GAMM|nr:SUF system NifU family Fe-S cluster assembly protein [Inmirania thermothiophila]ROR32597.1 Fe-S cluster assembly protein SufU [Inmirania thermothiophila]
MNDLRALYQEVIFDHNRSPRNFGRLAHANRRADGHNPLCGDRITLYLDVDEGGVIRDIAFEGQGCAISTASASLMTEALKGRTVAEAHRLFEGFHKVVTGEGSGEEIGKLAVLAGVRDYPMRVKCATLAWHTLEAALKGTEQPVSTE